MVLNAVKESEFYCLNEHPEPIKMIMRERSDDNKDNFYACPKYMRKDEKHPDGWGEGEHGCLNRLSLTDAGGIIMAFNEVLSNDYENGMIVDYTNYTFQYNKMITVKVLEYKNGKIKYGILNKKAIKG